MRRLEYLITEVRNDTDNKDNSAVKDAEIISYFNAGQRLIQSIVFKRNPKADIFKGVEVYNANADGVYDLPEDIWAVNAISLVEGRFGIATDVNQGYRPIVRVDENERSNLFGYFIRDNQLFITGANVNLQMQNVRITYFRKLPRFDKRWGTIQTVNSGVSLVMATGYDDDASSVDDHVSVVDASGSQVLSNILISSFAAATWNTTNALAGVSAGMFVCMGKDSQNLSELPDVCETYLIDYVKQRIITRNNYSDEAGKQVYFTDKQEKDIVDLFSNNTKEILYPPITDTTFLEF